MAGREREQLDEVAGAALPPHGGRDGTPTYADREATEEQNLDPIHRLSILRVAGRHKMAPCGASWQANLPRRAQVVQLSEAVPAEIMTIRLLLSSTAYRRL
jgi:hypothetical protein